MLIFIEDARIIFPSPLHLTIYSGKSIPYLSCHLPKRIQFFLKAARLLKCFSIYPSSCNYHPHCHLVSYSPFAIYMYMYICICVYIYVCVCTHICTWIYRYTYVYTDTHTYIQDTHIYMHI